MYDPEKYNDNKEPFLTRLGGIFEAVPASIVLVDINGQPLYLNKRGAEFFGMNKAGRTNKRAVCLKVFTAEGVPFSPEDMPVYRSLKNKEVVRHSEILIENSKGERIPALLICIPLYDSLGDATSAFIVIENMSERKQVMEKLNFQKHLLSNVKDAIAAYDRNMRITYWNEAAEKMYGWTEREMFGRPVEDLFCIDIHDPLKEKSIKKALLGRSRSGEVFLCHKNGRLLHTEVHTKVLTDKDGAYNGAVAVFHDITRRKYIETKISREKTLLQMINAIYEQSVCCDTLEDLGLACLKIIESATKSEISLIGEIREDRLFYDIALSRKGLDKNAGYARTGHNSVNGYFMNHGLVGAVLRAGQTMLINDAKEYPESLRMPEGHPQIYSFLATPFMRNGSVTGVVSVANREGGYGEEEKEILEALTPSVMEVLLRKRAEEALKKSDERLAFLLKLSDAIRPLEDQEAIEATASALLAEHLGAKTSYIKCGEYKKIYEVSFKQTKTDNGYLPDAYPTAFNMLYSGKTVIIENFGNSTLLSAAECGQALARGVYANITFPLLKNGKLVACLSVSVPEPRRWTALEVSLVQETAERTWTAVERALAEEALKRREQQFRTLVTASSEILFHMSPDWSVMTQLHDSEKQNTAWFEEYMQPDDYLQINEIIDGAISNRSIIELEHRIKTADGGVGWAYTRAVPMLDNMGGIIAWFGSSTNITDRKKADEQLLKNKQRNELLASITSRLLLSENPQQIVYDLCTAAMDHIGCDVFFNYFVDDQKGCLHLNATTGIPEEDVAKFEWLDFGAAVCGCVAQQGQRIVAECILETPDSRTVELAGLGIKAYACHPLKAENTVIGTLGFGSRSKQTFTEDELIFMNSISDYIAIAMGRLLTNNKLVQSEKHAYELVEQLRKEDENKNAFLSILSHELRNPLATIMAGISLLDVTKDKKKKCQAKEIVKRQSAQLSRLIDDLLDITRITQNKIRLRKENVDLSRLALLAAEDMRVQFEQKGILLETAVPFGRFNLEADPARISQIIGNLLHNALKFTDSGGRVKVSVKKGRGEAVISVKDNGIGMREEMLETVFQPFTQADESLERSAGGLGMGLAIAKGICELHGGTIRARSGGLGQGSEFQIRLPVNPLATGQKENAVPENIIKRRLRILLIEDNKDFAELLCSMFRQTGHEAYLAFRGPEGVKQAKTMKPDIIFCDIGLPDMNGYEVARIIKGDEETKGAYLVALTGYAGQQDIELAADAGFDKHIAKPVNIETLRRVLNQFC